MRRDDSILTQFVDSVFSLFRLAEFEILFVLFFIIAYVIFKDLIISWFGSISLIQLLYLMGFLGTPWTEEEHRMFLLGKIYNYGVFD
ncbi:hypothetical protein F2Q70_00027169 [Brassica cretica]|uniref:Uncharacterized protein n=1 Tax=Brassica cretica TaxID=69181 RepID=A0A8S9LEI5_BRACR|nr:hypothetical protein F2Q70_00027169 [Brassica cretica]